MANIGDTFSTGQTAPVSGIYSFVGSVDPLCTPPVELLELPLPKGARFPVVDTCHGSVVWELTSFA